MLMPMRMRRYAGGYHELSPTVRDLWAVLADFSRDDRAAFLKFVTSCSKPPLLGFAHLHPAFTVQCVASDGNEVPSVLAFFGMGRKETSRLPTAATCFNLLKARFPSILPAFPPTFPPSALPPSALPPNLQLHRPLC